MALRDDEALGIYLSLPFCRSKCPFCNFASGLFPHSDRPRYLQRLRGDMADAPRFANSLGVRLPRAVDSVYLGGGSPSILETHEIDALFDALRQHFELLPNAEITIEAVPGTLSEATLDALLQASVNRISLGVQTFVEREAAWSGRRHSPESIRAEIEWIRRAGLCEISVDLIAGLPGQDPASWQLSLDTLVASGVPHASVYMLEVDQDSRLGREILAGGSRFHAAEVPAEEQVAEFYQTAIDRLASAGLTQYEISNFARPGHHSRHNLRYWQRRPYLGLGLDAASMLRAAPGHGHDGEVLRFSSTDTMPDYLAGAPLTECEWLSPARQLEEAWFLGLRTNAGVDAAALALEFGPQLLAPAMAQLPPLLSVGLVEYPNPAHPTLIRLTPQGRLLANEVFEQFLDLRPATAG